MTSSRSLARNALHLVIGQGVTMVLGILFNAALGRTLGAGDFGLYFLISSFAAFALVVVDWGQQYFGIREIARAPERAGELLGTGLVLRSIGTALACLLTAISARALGYDGRTVAFAAAFVALNLPFFMAQGFGMIFRAHDRMALDAAVSVSNRAAGLVFALAALWLGFGLLGVVVSQGLAGAVALLVAGQLYRRVSPRPLQYSPETAREVLAGGTSILLMAVAVSVQPYIDAVLLSKMVPKEAVGWYGAAKTIIGMLNAPAMILGAAALPRLSRATVKVELFREELTLAQRPMVWVAGLGAVGTWLFADVAIDVVYGHRGFGPAGAILSVFGLGLFLVFVDTLLGNAFIALGRTASFSALKILTVALATALELFLIPYFQRRSGNGGIGVVTAFVACETVIFAGMILLLPRGTVGRGLLIDAARAIGASVFVGALFWLMARKLTPWVAIPACIAAYTLTTLALGLLHLEDVRGLRRLLAQELGGASSAAVKGTTPS